MPCSSIRAVDADDQRGVVVRDLARRRVDVAVDRAQQRRPAPLGADDDGDEPAACLEVDGFEDGHLRL